MSSSCSSSSSFDLVNVIKAMATTVAPHSCLPFAGKSFHHMFCFCFMALKALPAGNFGTCPTDLSVWKALDVEAAVLQQSSLARCTTQGQPKLPLLPLPPTISGRLQKWKPEEAIGRSGRKNKMPARCNRDRHTQAELSETERGRVCGKARESK